MRCGEVREYLFAYLDNELDVPLSIELQRHLEACHDCAREVEIEWAVKRQLGQVLTMAGGELPIDEEILRCAQNDVEHDVERVAAHRAGGGKVTLSEAKNLLRFGRLASLTAVAAGVVLAFGAWYALRSESKPGPHSRFADLVVTDFQHFLEKGRPVQIASADHHKVAAWLRDGTKLDIMLTAAPDPHCKLVGGRKCKIDGRPGGFAVYDMDGTPASLVVVDAEHASLEGMERVEGAGGMHWVDRCRGHTVVARRRDRLVYAAVSTLPEKELLCLMRDAVHEGD